MEIAVGKKVSIKKSFSQDEVYSYSLVSNDTNPIHYDVEYAACTSFKKPIVQGLLTASLFGGLLGAKLPGNGTILLSQTLKFSKPVYVNEIVEAIIKVISIRQDKPVITFEAICIKENGEIAIEGEFVVIYKGTQFI